MVNYFRGDNMNVILIILVIYFILINTIRYLKNNNIRINKNDYVYKGNPMTETEKIFLGYLKPFTDKRNLIVMSQVPLQAIFKTNNNANFNKIKAKTIDFAIVYNNYNYRGFIELDDYTHNRNDRVKRDIFVNELFTKNSFI